MKKKKKKPKTIVQIVTVDFHKYRKSNEFFLCLNIVLLAVPVVPVVLDITTEYHYKEGKLQSLNFHLHMEVWKDGNRERERLGDALYMAIF